MSLQSGSIDIDFSDLNSMQSALDFNKQLEAKINQNIQKCLIIDVSVAMKNLANVGNIIKLAYAGSKGFPCSTVTIEILSKYQSMIKNTFITTVSFVDACLAALKYHKMGLILAEKGKLENSLKIIEKCSELAGKMAVKSAELASEAKNLCDLSEKALITAQNDHTVSETEKKEIIKMINEARARQAKLESTIKSLYDQINEARQKEQEISKKADKERDRAFSLKMISSIVAPIVEVGAAAGSGGMNELIKGMNKFGGVNSSDSNEGSKNHQLDILKKDEERVTKDLAEVQEKIKNSANNNEPKDLVESLTKNENELKKQLDQIKLKITEALSANKDQKSESSGLEQQELEIMRLKHELQKEEREANAEIARTGALLKGLNQQENDLSASIISLELAIKALGKIKTTFENTRAFWEGVKARCENLSNISDLKMWVEVEEQNEYINELKESGLEWLVLGKINYTASLTIKAVDEKTDDILNNLPTKSEALEVVQNEADMILNTLQNEVSALK